MPTLSVALDPVNNLLYSLLLLTKGEEHMPGLLDWVPRTREAMSLEERMRHHLVMSGLFHAFVPDADWQSFAGYLDHLASSDPTAMQDRLLGMYSRISNNRIDFREPAISAVPDKSRILSSVGQYLEFLDDHFHNGFDPDLEAQAYRYVADPPAMKELVVGHLRSMWDKYLAPEWTRVRPMLMESVNAFRTVELAGLPRLEAVKVVTGREPADPRWEAVIEDARRLVFVPNAHIGPYLGKTVAGSTMTIVFGARLPEGSRVDAAPELTRTEIVTRLSALADDGRLRILRMAVEAGELRAPDVMLALDISQSAASRHLTQLTANGYLVERRREGGKCYSFNPGRAADCLGAVARYLRLASGAAAGAAGS